MTPRRIVGRSAKLVVTSAKQTRDIRRELAGWAEGRGVQFARGSACIGAAQGFEYSRAQTEAGRHA
jgi:hypothetical protein